MNLKKIKLFFYLKKYGMMNIGDNMASRMDKYYNKNFQATNRRQRNQLLYQEDEKKYRSDMGSKLEEIFKNEKDYRKRKQILKEKILEDDDYISKNYKNYSTYKRPITKQDDEKIKDLIQTIVVNSYNNQIRKLKLQQLKKMIENKKPSEDPKSKHIDKLDPIFSIKKINENQRDRNLNLKIKITVGILFLINTIFIFYFFYTLIK